MEEQLSIPVKKHQDYITTMQKETFIPDREKDEMTEALGNPYHPGRTRGTPASVAWVHGFPGAGGYICEKEESEAEQNAEGQCKISEARGTCSCQLIRLQCIYNF